MAIPDSHTTNGKSTVSVVISAVVAAFVVIGAIGGMALAPLYISTNSNANAITDLKRDLATHVGLPSHPVMEARLTAEVKRLDERITVNDGWTKDIQARVVETEKNFAAYESQSKSSFREIETQFDADSQFRNIQFSDLQRKTNIIWDHIPALGAYPEAPFFQPNISNRK